jgi:hypothetical protein
VLFVAIGVSTVVSAVCGTLNLRLAHRYAQASGSSLAGLIKDDVDIRRDYPGTYLKAQERFTTGVMELGVTILALVVMIVSWIAMNWNARILEFIERHRQNLPAAAGDGETAPERCRCACGNMTTRAKMTVKACAVVVGLWVLVVLFIIPGMPSARGHAIIAAVRNQAHQIEGRELNREELANALGAMKLDFGLNRFQPQVTFAAPTNWNVVLVPDNRSTFTDVHTWPFRLFFLDFSRTQYPDILISGGNAWHSRVPPDTARKLADPQH